jgi:hypothetical protein
MNKMSKTLATVYRQDLRWMCRAVSVQKISDEVMGWKRKKRQVEINQLGQRVISYHVIWLLWAKGFSPHETSRCHKYPCFDRFTCRERRHRFGPWTKPTDPCIHLCMYLGLLPSWEWDWRQLEHQIGLPVGFADKYLCNYSTGRIYLMDDSLVSVTLFQQPLLQSKMHVVRELH